MSLSSNGVVLMNSIGDVIQQVNSVASSKAAALAQMDHDISALGGVNGGVGSQEVLAALSAVRSKINAGQDYSVELKTLNDMYSALFDANSIG